jgi:hypothetical protein
MCAKTPNVAKYLDQGMLMPSIPKEVEQFIPRSTPEDSLKSITMAVADCPATTCRNVRELERCQTQCAEIKLFMNGSTPNVYEKNALTSRVAMDINPVTTMCERQKDSMLANFAHTLSASEA